MIDLRRRSDQKELLDGDTIPFTALKRNLKELNFINTWLGGHTITLRGIKRSLSNVEMLQPITICEIGCGGGDNLFVIYQYCIDNKIKANFIGVDLNEGCINYARQRYPQLTWICSDYAKVKFERNPTVIFSSLFCHHFTDDQLIEMLQWLQQNSRNAFFINDLQRHPLPYFLIKYSTKIFSRSYLVKNDACLSVARSFIKKDWIELFKQAGIKNYTISWQWAFRWLVMVDNKLLHE
ncbi:MAG TPA: methyltransferase domain-containing protein [Ferruginibacter sp.]|nr:methyltransferase domain-containing protein [Ferruginibacter sp.]